MEPMCSFSCSSLMAQSPRTSGGILRGTPSPPPNPSMFLLKIPLFKGKIMSLCSLGLDQRQSLSRNKGSLRLGAVSFLLPAKKETVLWLSFFFPSFLMPFPALVILMPWKPHPWSSKVFLKDKHPYYEENRSWLPSTNWWAIWHQWPSCPVRGRSTDPLSPFLAPT